MLCQFTQAILPICHGDYLKYPCCFPQFAYSNLAYMTDKLEILVPIVDTRQKHKIRDSMILRVKLYSRDNSEKTKWKKSLFYYWTWELVFRFRCFGFFENKLWLKFTLIFFFSGKAIWNFFIVLSTFGNYSAFVESNVQGWYKVQSSSQWSYQRKSQSVENGWIRTDWPGFVWN